MLSDVRNWNIYRDVQARAMRAVFVALRFKWREPTIIHIAGCVARETFAIRN